MYNTETIDLTRTSRRMTDEGYLIVENATLARTGIQEYLAAELGTPDGFNPGDIIRVYRPTDEVFAPASMESFALKPVTNDHPNEMLNIDNLKQHQIGTVGDRVQQQDTHMMATLSITDKQAIDEIQSGKVELSNGYFSDYVFGKGTTPDGEHYDAKQINIRGNHVAIVDRGRCGGSCRIMDTDKINKDCGCGGDSGNCKCGGSMDKVTMKIAGVDCQVEAQTAQLITKAMDEAQDEAKSKEDQIKDLQSKIDALKEEIKKEEDDSKSSKDSLQAKIDELEKQVLNADQLDEKIAQRQEFIDTVVAFDKDIDWKGKSEDELIVAVVTSANADEDFEGKSPEYMRARFDAIMVAGGKKPSKDEMDEALRKNADKKKSGNKDGIPSADEAREAFLERSSTAYQNPTEAV